MNSMELFKRNLNEKSTLKDALSTLDPDTLKDIFYFMKMKSAKKIQKGELINIIAGELPANAQRFIKSFDNERYELYKRIRENDGVLYDFDITDEKIFALTQIGMIFPVVIRERRALFIPREIINSVDEEDNEELAEIAGHNTKFINKIHGMMYYYGYLTLDEIFQLALKRKAAGSIENLFFLETIYLAVLYYNQITPEGIGFKHKNLVNCELMLELRDNIAKIEKHKPYSEKKLQKAGSINYMEWTPDMEKFKRFLINKGNIEEDKAEREIEDIWYEFNNGADPESVCVMFIERFFSGKNDDIISGLVCGVVQMYLTMPSWLFKGYTFEEIIRLERVAC